MFEFLPQNMQGTICQDFGNVKKNEMIKYLKVLKFTAGNLPAVIFNYSSNKYMHLPK